MKPLEPSLSFSIPSLDGTQLECRLYHPTEWQTESKTWLNTIAIVAHPYAPLGGCYDVPMVLDTVRALLKEDVTVGTFNFRGAGASGGRTSWTGKGEISDYESFILFLLFYMTLLRQELSATPDMSGNETPNPPPETVAQDEDVQTLQLILAGYSYGSLAVMHLPCIKEILNGSIYLPVAKHAGDIVIIARSLATETAERTRGKQHRGGHVRIGSRDEVQIRERHARQQVKDALKHLPKPLSRRNTASNATSSIGAAPFLSFPSIRPHYLLISPILPPLPHAVMLPFAQKQQGQAAWQKHPTFAIFGDRDGFSSIKKLLPWAKRLTDKEESKFTYVAVATAGHFWIEQGVAEKMEGAVREWTRATILTP